MGFIKNDAGGELQHYWNEIFPTIRATITPAIAMQESFNLTTCDANGTRKDRPNGGLYVTEADASKTVTAGGPNAETVVIAIDGDKIKPKERAGGSGMGVSEDGVMYTQTAGDVHAVAYEESVGVDPYNGAVTGEASATLGVNCGDSTGRNGVLEEPETSWQATVRRLLPIECERLMGFPDNHTRIPWKGKAEEDCPDAPRYKACGNSMAVNCMMWIGERIQMVENEIQGANKSERNTN
jgi:DNA (cytosine-5)-methyltransferase 1